MWHVQDKEVVSYVLVEYVYTSVAALTSVRDVCCLSDKFLEDNQNNGRAALNEKATSDNHNDEDNILLMKKNASVYSKNFKCFLCGKSNHKKYRCKKICE